MSDDKPGPTPPGWKPGDPNPTPTPSPSKPDHEDGPGQHKPHDK